VFTVVGLLALIASALAAACVTGLSLAAGASWPAALLSAGAAFLAVLVAIPGLIDRKDAEGTRRKSRKHRH
jgi:hypothetical protein